MAAGNTYIFDTATQADVNNFAAGDTLIFGGAKPQDLSVTFAAGNALQNDSVTLSFGGHTLTFAADALNAATKQFTQGGELYIGTSADDAPVALTNAKASAAYGFDGNDTFNITGSGSYVVNGGAGTDTIDASGTTAVSGNYAGHYLLGGDGADTITGGQGNDHIYGNLNTSVVGSKDGADVIHTGGGNDYVNGNAGNDIIFGGELDGNTRLYGGQDNDSISVTGAGSNHVNGNMGDDYITAGAVAAADVRFGNTTAITAATGNNDLHGGQGNDTIVAGKGNDQLFGDAGNDTLIAGTGATHVTVMTGGAGADTFDFSVAGSGAMVKFDATTGLPSSAALPASGVYYQEITDFTAGTDLIKVGTVGASTNFAVLKSSYANVLEAYNAATNDFATNVAHKIDAAQVGADTYLFYKTASGTEVIKLDAVTAANIDFHSFV